jgi:hypothetical protein
VGGGSDPDDAGTDAGGDGETTAGGTATTDGADGESGERTDTDTTAEGGLPADLRREDGGLVVDYPAFSDGDVTVEQESLIEFARGDRFEVLGIDNGDGIEPGAQDPLVAVSRTVAPTDQPWAYVAPVLREGSGFEFRVYANAAFRELREMRLLAGGGTLVGTEADVLSRPAAFEEIADGVFRDTTDGEEVPGAEPGEPLAVLVSEVTYEQLNEDSPSPTGVFCQPVDGRSDQRSAPNVAFAFEYDSGAGTVTITHEGGDTVEGANLTVRLGGEPTDAQFEGSVSAGSELAVDASGYDSGTTLRIVWQSPEGDASAVLASFDLP